MLRLKTALVLAIRYLFLTRYSWLLALVLLAIVPLSLDLMPRLLANLFVFDLPKQIFHVSWIAMWCAATVMETLRATTMNAHLRFDDYRIAAEKFRDAWGIEVVDDSRQWYRSRVGWGMLLLGLAVAIGIWHRIMEACIAQTVRDPSDSWSQFVDISDEAAMATFCWKYAVAGLATTVVVLGLLNGLMILLYERRIRNSQSEESSFIQSLYACCASITGPGYFREESSSDEADANDAAPSLHLAPGHLRLVLYTVAFLTWYAINYATATGANPMLAGANDMPTESSAYVALFYTLLSFLLLLYFLPGFAFYWDRYRIPVPLLIIVVTLILYRTFGTDHYYYLNESPLTEEPFEKQNLIEVFSDWEFPAWPDGKKTLVVVDASGGGIQASAWTAQVLTGLDERYGSDFSKSIGLISSVSGGSVGTMFYLVNRAEMNVSPDPAVPIGEPLTAETIDGIRNAAQSSALEATAWGLAYPDTLRTVLPFVVDEHVDRGWAIEQVWRQRMKSTGPDKLDRGNLTLIDLAKAIKQNHLPVPVFNATLMENGKRLQISPVLAPPIPVDEERDQVPDAAVELLKEFPRARPLIATAARLSATFPYVTPAARSDCPHESKYGEFHVVDGAYVDNEGAVTSVDWINRLLAHYERHPEEERPFDRVVLLRIQAFPAAVGQAAGNEPPSSPGWRSALIGPIDAMLTVRSASQTERGDLEVGLLANATRAKTEVRARIAEFNAEQSIEDASAAKAQLDVIAEDATIQANLSPAELARMQAMSRDAFEIAKDVQESVKQVEEEVIAATEIEVIPVMIDFQSPNKSIAIPMSWKLTSKQKDNVQQAWTSLTNKGYRQRPLKKLDSFFKIGDEQ